MSRVITDLNEAMTLLLESSHLEDVTFQGIHFHEAKFKPMMLENCSFVDCRLTYCRFPQLSFRRKDSNDALFIECSLDSCEFSKIKYSALPKETERLKPSFCFSDDTEFESCKFSNGVMDRCIFGNTKFYKSEFYGCSLDFSYFYKCNHLVTQMNDCQGIQMRWEKGKAENSRFKNCDFRFLWTDIDFAQARFDSTSLIQSEFVASVLSSVNFRSCNMDGCTLDNCETKASGAFIKVQECSLRGACFKECDFPMAEFWSCDMGGIQMMQVDLSNGTIAGASYDSGEDHMGSMEEAFLDGCDLSGVEVERISLRNAFFRDCETKRIKMKSKVRVDGWRI